MHVPCAITCCWCLLGLVKLAILLPCVMLPRQWKLVPLRKVSLRWELQWVVYEACVLVFACMLAPEAMRPMTLQQACLQSGLWTVLVGIYLVTEASPAQSNKTATHASHAGTNSGSALEPAGCQAVPQLEAGHVRDKQEEEQGTSDETEPRPYCSTCTDSRTSISSCVSRLSRPASGELDKGAAVQPAKVAHVGESFAAVLGFTHADAAYGSFNKPQTTSVYLKIPWAEPEDLAEDWEDTLQQRVAERTCGHVLVAGTTVRRGCIELVIDLVRTRPDAAADPAGAASQDVAARAASLFAGPLAQLMGGGQVQDASDPVCLPSQLHEQGPEPAVSVGGAGGTAAGAGGGSNWDDELIDSLQPQDWVHWLYLQPPRDAEVLVQACGRAFVTSWDGTQWATRELPRGLGPDGQPLPTVLPKILDAAPACMMVPVQEPLLMSTPAEPEGDGSASGPLSSFNCCCASSVPRPLTIKLTGPLLDKPEVKITARFHGRYLAIEPAPPAAASNASAWSCGTSGGSVPLDQRSWHSVPGASVTVPFVVRGVDQPGMLLLECWFGKLLTSRKQVVVVDNPHVATELEAYYKLQATEMSAEAGPPLAAHGTIMSAHQPAASQATTAQSDAGDQGTLEPHTTEAQQCEPKVEGTKSHSTHSLGDSPRHTMSLQHMQQQISGSDRSSDDLMTDLGCWVEFMAAMQQMHLLQRRQTADAKEADATALLAAADISQLSRITTSQLEAARASEPHASNPPAGMDGVAVVVGTGAISHDGTGALPHACAGTAQPGTPGTCSTGPVSKRLFSTASLSAQLLHASRHPAYQAQMQEVGIQLLEHCCSCAWLATADMLLLDLLKLGIPFSRIKSEATTSGMTLLHRAVCSGSQQMVQAVVRWGTEHGDAWNWSEADPANGITPLHVAAVVPTAVVRMHQSKMQRDDKGTLADWILQEYEAAWQYWHGATDATGSTPADIAEAHAGGGGSPDGLPMAALQSEGFLAAIVASTAGNFPAFADGDAVMDEDALATVDGGFGSELTTLAVTLASHEGGAGVGDRFAERMVEYAQDLSPDQTAGSSEDICAAYNTRVAMGTDSGDGDDAACPAHLLRAEASRLQLQWKATAAADPEGAPGGQTGNEAHAASDATQAGHAVEAEGSDPQLLPDKSAGPAQAVSEQAPAAHVAASRGVGAEPKAPAAGPQHVVSAGSSNTESSHGSQQHAGGHAYGPKQHATAAAASTEQLPPGGIASELRQRAGRKTPLVAAQPFRGAPPLPRVSSGGSSSVSAAANVHSSTAALQSARTSHAGSERLATAVARETPSRALGQRRVVSPERDEGQALALSDPAGVFVLLRATLLFFPAATDEESYCVWVAKRRTQSAQLVQVFMTIILSVALGYELGVGGARGCVTIFAYAVPWGAMWTVRRQLPDNSQVQAKLLAEPMSVMLLLWGVAVRSFQAAGLLPAPHTLGGLLPVGTDCVVEVVVHTLLQVRLPNMLLPRCLYVLASAALYIRLGLAASTAHALAMVGIYNLVAVMTCAAVDFRNRCLWAVVHGVPGVSAPSPQSPGSAPHAAWRKLH